MRLLTWNLYHGRAYPEGWGRELLDVFSSTLNSWEWDLALLQEVPPWWGESLGRACQAHAYSSLTSRNSLPSARRALASRFPDLLKSNGGGSNLILSRLAPALQHETTVLRLKPERRVAQGIYLGGGVWVVNLHAQNHRPHWAREDLERAFDHPAWRDTPALILGGDTNLKQPCLPGMTSHPGQGVDHILSRGFQRVGETETLERGALSDHRPVRLQLRQLAFVRSGKPRQALSSS